MKEICNLLKKEIRKEIEKDKINTQRIRMLSDSLDKFESMLVISVDDVIDNNTNNLYFNGYSNSVVPVRTQSNGSMIDSLSDAFNTMLKKSDNDIKLNSVEQMIKWYHFLNDYQFRIDVEKQNDISNLIEKLVDVITFKIDNNINKILNENKNVIVNTNEQE
ncbi:hypothetical protein KKF82_05545 [Patescibacteria group bacterium]|nr:hypothetical protein [Patescibacteria group bacterium]